METLRKIIILFTLITVSSSVGFCQDTTGVKRLIHQGTALNDSGKYAEAIDKYKAALKIDPGNEQAQYEMSYTLVACGRANEAIPILEKILPAGDYPEAYNLIADIYDDKNDFEKSVAYYQQGITAFPDNQRLRFNLGISYLRQKKYPEAEQAAIKSIQLNPKHASSQRLYALAMYHQNRGVPAIMAFCSFLMLEPQTQRSAEAYQYIQKIIQSKVKVDTAKGANKAMTIYVQDNKGAGGDEFTLETFLSMAAAMPTIDTIKNQSGVDILNEQLSSIFKVAGELSYKRKVKDFFWKFYADYFYQLSKSDNMPAFVRLVSLTGYRDDNLKWFKGNNDKLIALDNWVVNTKREF